jgi:membrane-associated phospholipid phosphatase
MNLSIRRLIRENISFFTGFLFYLIACAALLNIIEQGDEIFYFSERRTDPGNSFFLFMTQLGEGWAFIGGLILLVLYRYRSALYLPLVGLSVSLLSFLSKSFFAHQRPSLYFRNLGLLDEINIVEGIHLNGGLNSFPSGHTMAAFALYTYLALCLPWKRWSGLFFFLLAALVGLSRIYLVQHFLKDIYLGAILGAFIALAFYYLQLHRPRGEKWEWGLLRSPKTTKGPDVNI